jgi:hypothetical protein
VGVGPIVRHNVANVFFDGVTRDNVQVWCHFRATFTPDGGIWRISHRNVSIGWAAPNSLVARPSR